MKKLIKILLVCIVLALMVLVGLLVTNKNSHLAKFSDEQIVYDVSEVFDVNKYLSEVKDGTEISYDFDKENSHLTVNLVNGKKSEVLEADVNLIYPRVDIPEEITIDTFVGYDIKDIVSADADVNLSSKLDEEKGELTISYSKGEYTNSIVKKVTLTSSNPKDNARYYSCQNIMGVGYEMVVYPDFTLEEVETSTGNVYPGEWVMLDNNNGEMFHMLNSPRWWRIGLYFSDDSKEASFFVGNDKKGGQARDVCKLTDVKPFNEDMKIFK